MAAAFVQGTGLQSTGSVASLAKAFASNVTAGNAIFVGAISFDETIGAGNCADSLSNTYTRDSNVVHTGANAQACLFSAPNIAGGACTVTIDPTGSATMGIGIAEFSGMVTTAILNAQNTGTTQNAAPVTGNIVATQNVVIVGVITYDGTQVTITPGATYTQIFEDEDANDMPISWQYKIVAAATYTANWTLSGSRDYACAGAAYKEAAAAAATPPRPRIVRQAVMRASSW